VAQPEPGLEPDQTSLERPENGCATMLTIHPKELERICREWEKLSKYRCDKLLASYQTRLKAVIAAKGASTTY
jgi:NAD(P)H-hydrate repair Nnr-like enzyme with NAD(P)H-hydrate dehydratase domain